MKTPLVAVVVGGALALLYLARVRFDVATYVIILFGTSLISWTIEQYGSHPNHH